MNFKVHRKIACEERGMAESGHPPLQARSIKSTRTGRRLCAFKARFRGMELPVDSFFPALTAVPAAYERSSFKRFPTRGHLVDLVAAGANRFQLLVEQLRRRLRRLPPFQFYSSQDRSPSNQGCRVPLPISWIGERSIPLEIKTLGNLRHPAIRWRESTQAERPR